MGTASAPLATKASGATKNARKDFSAQDVTRSARARTAHNVTTALVLATALQDGEGHSATYRAGSLMAARLADSVSA